MTLPTLDDERREREANEQLDPEELLHREPPPDDDAEVIDQDPDPGPELVIDEGVPSESAVVVDMDPPRGDGMDIVDISRPSLETAGQTLFEPAMRLAARTRNRDLSRKRKLAYLLSQEVRRIVEELALRHDLLLQVWSKHRSRQPLLHVLRTRYEELRPDDLLLLPVDCLEGLEQFYRVLDEFRLYLQVTEDMPTTLESTYEHFRLALSQIGQPLLWNLDGVHRYGDSRMAAAPPVGALLE